MDEIIKEEILNERDTRNNQACRLAYDGKYQEAIKIFDELLEINPQDFRALSNKATIIGKSGRYEESLDLFEQLVSRSPHMLSTRICFINLLTYFDKFERALECRRQMPRPGAIESMLLGMLSTDFKKLEQYEKEEGTVEKAIKKLEKYRAEVKSGQSSEDSPRFMSLIMAGPPPFPKK